MRILNAILFSGLAAIAFHAGSVLGSNVIVSNTAADPGDTSVPISVTLKNIVPYAGFEFTLQYDAAFLSLDTIEASANISSLSGTGYYEYALGKASVVVFDYDGMTLAADSTVVFNLLFDVLPDAPVGSAQIRITEATAVMIDWQLDSLIVTNGFITVPTFLCGDANADYAIDISDAVYLIAYIFSGGSAPNPEDAGDANCDGAVDISDAVYLIAFIFSGGPAPCAACK